MLLNGDAWKEERAKEIDSLKNISAMLAGSVNSLQGVPNRRAQSRTIFFEERTIVVERRRRQDHPFVSKVVFFFLNPHWIHARLTVKEDLFLSMSNVVEML